MKQPKKALAEKNTVEANMKMYTHTWDEIMNKGKLDMFNDSNFTKDVVMHASPADVIGIVSARAYVCQLPHRIFKNNFYYQRCFWAG